MMRSPSSALSPSVFLHMIAAAFAVIATCSISAAEDPPELVTDRPDQTESTAIVPPGSFQVETGWTHTEDDEGGEFQSDSVVETLLRIGLMKDLELRLGFAGYTWQNVETPEGLREEDKGASDTEVGFKIHLWDESGWRPDAALLAHLSLPTGGRGYTSNRADPSFRFSFSHTLTERLSWGYNLGMAWATEEDEFGDEDTRAAFQYTTTLGYAVTDRLGAFIELFGDVPTHAHSSAAHSVDGGFTYKILPNVQLDLAAGRGISEEADDWFVGMGVSFRIPR